MVAGKYCTHSKAKRSLADKDQESTCGTSLDVKCVSLDPVLRSRRSLMRCRMNLLQFSYLAFELINFSVISRLGNLMQGNRNQFVSVWIY